MRKTQNLSKFLSKKKVIKHPGGGSVISGARFIGRGLKYLSAVSVRPVLYHLLRGFIGRGLKYLSAG